MPSRENQGLQIALILFAMITVALAVTTYIFYDKAGDAAQSAETAKNQAREAESRRNAAEAQNTLLKDMIGISTLTPPEKQAQMQVIQGTPEQEELEQIQAAFEEDVKLFAVANDVLGSDEGWVGGQDWMSLADYLTQVVQKRTLEWSNEKQRADQAEAERDAQVQAEVAKTQQAEQGQQSARTDLLATRGELEKERASFQDQARQLQERMTQAQALAKQEVDRITGERDAQQSRAGRLELLLNARDEKIDLLETKPYTDQPHGSIRWVDQKSRMAYIDLGLADGVQRQMTFSVYGQDETQQSNAIPKASIEVTQIIDRHLSKARILEDTLINPILPGDVIHTPVWVPGRRVHFALAGFMDINGDGQSDRHIVKNLISVNGGVIDAEVTDQGQPTGKLSSTTRYLVLGEPPSATSGAVTGPFSQIQSDADQLGVEKIHFQKLLGWMGYKGEFETTKLGSRGAADRSSSAPFRPRTPAGSAPGSAYP